MTPEEFIIANEKDRRGPTMSGPSTDALVKKLDEYIELIIKDAKSAAYIATVHGWRSNNIEQGIKLRDEIEQLRNIDTGEDCNE